MPMTRPALDLPRLVMRRALVVAAITLVAAVAMGFVRAGADIDDETDAAQSLARVMARLATLSGHDDDEALEALRGLQERQPLRHLRLSIADGRGVPLLWPAAEPQEGWPLRWLVAAHRWWAGEPPGEPVSWQVARPGGAPWRVTLAPSRSSERREAIADVMSLVVVLLAGGATMLAVMAYNVRGAFRPLESLLRAIEGVPRGEIDALRRLPPMPIRELQALASALQGLGDALAAAERERRVLGQKVLSLQEEERHRLARELHDEFGQRLTALRVDLSWLQRRLHGEDEMLQVAQGMVTHCERIQADIRRMLARLQPLGPGLASHADDEEAGEGERVERLAELLQSLVQGWHRPGEFDVRLQIELPPGPPPLLPRDVMLAVYRISQEALTNVARHAQARHAVLRLAISRLAAREGRGALAVDWSVRDDGVGLDDPAAALRRGNGLAGIKERIWALGGDLQWQAASPGSSEAPGSRGLVLAAHWVVGADDERSES